jgi:hypothetical protein
MSRRVRRLLRRYRACRAAHRIYGYGESTAGRASVVEDPNSRCRFGEDWVAVDAGSLPNQDCAASPENLGRAGSSRVSGGGQRLAGLQSGEVAERRMPRPRLPAGVSSITPGSAGMNTVARRLLGDRPELDAYERATPRIVLPI